jgi:outer membrane protein assembly factor BamB
MMNMTAGNRGFLRSILSAAGVVTIVGIAGSSMGCSQTASCWPQWGGPNRDFTVTAPQLASSWPDDGPKVLWSRTLGDGYSTVITDGTRLYTMYRGEDDRETVIAMNRRTGRTIWEHKYDAPVIKESDKKSQVTQFGIGPGGSPLVVDGLVYTVGFTGIVSCLEAATGTPVWSHDLYAEEDLFLKFGYAVSPIAYGDVVIVLAGGRSDNGVIAYDRRTGDVVWKSTGYKCSYSSPIIVSVDGLDHLVAYMGEDIVGLSPATGELQWTVKHESQYSTIITPIWCSGNRVFLINRGSTGGGILLQLTRRDDTISANVLWTNKKVKGGLNNPLRIGQTAYGPGGARASVMIAFDIDTGEVLWKERGFPQIKGIYADGKMILLDGDGHLMLADANREGITVTSKAKLLEKPAWTSPTLSGTTLFLRDRKSVMAVDLR